MALTINHLSKSFGEHIVLKDFSANIPTGQVTLLTAPSGRGKTTLLRILCSFSGRQIMRKFKRIIQHQTGISSIAK